jgi:hypothetical protein
MKSVAATFSIVCRSARMAGIDPMSGAAASCHRARPAWRLSGCGAGTRAMAHLFDLEDQGGDLSRRLQHLQFPWVNQRLRALTASSTSGP